MPLEELPDVPLEDVTPLVLPPDVPLEAPLDELPLDVPVPLELAPELELAPAP
jgi:hypothetical protein